MSTTLLTILNNTPITNPISTNAPIQKPNQNPQAQSVDPNNTNSETKSDTNQKKQSGKNRRRRQNRKRRKKEKARQKKLELEALKEQEKEKEDSEEKGNQPLSGNLTETAESYIDESIVTKVQDVKASKILNLGTNSSESDNDNEEEVVHNKKKDLKKIRDKYFNEFVDLGREMIKQIFHEDDITSFNDSANFSEISSSLIIEENKQLASDFFSQKMPEPGIRKMSCVELPNSTQKPFQKRRGSMVINLEQSDQMIPNKSKFSQFVDGAEANCSVGNWREQLEHKNRKDVKRERLKGKIEVIYRRLSLDWSLKEIRWWNEQLGEELRKLYLATPNKLKFVIRIIFEIFDEIFPKTGAKAAEVLRVFSQLVNNTKDINIFDNLLVRVQKCYHFMAPTVKNQLQKMLRNEFKVGKKDKEKRGKLDSLITPMFQRGKNAKKKLKYVNEMSAKADHFSINDLTRRYPVMVSGGQKVEKKFFDALNSKWNREMDKHTQKKNRFIEKANNDQFAQNSCSIFVLKSFDHNANNKNKFFQSVETSNSKKINKLDDSVEIVQSIEKEKKMINGELINNAENTVNSQTQKTSIHKNLLDKRGQLDSNSSINSDNNSINQGKKKRRRRRKRKRKKIQNLCLSQSIEIPKNQSEFTFDSLTKDFDKLGIDKITDERSSDSNSVIIKSKKYVKNVEKHIVLSKRTFKIKKVKGAEEFLDQKEILKPLDGSFFPKKLSFQDESILEIKKFKKEEII